MTGAIIRSSALLLLAGCQPVAGPAAPPPIVYCPAPVIAHAPHRQIVAQERLSPRQRREVRAMLARIRRQIGALRRGYPPFEGE